MPPTSQNPASIEADLRSFVQPRIRLDAEGLTRQCEQAICNYDPCISCATHFLTLDSRGRPVSRALVVGVPVVLVGVEGACFETGAQMSGGLGRACRCGETAVATALGSQSQAIHTLWQ